MDPLHVVGARRRLAEPDRLAQRLGIRPGRQHVLGQRDDDRAGPSIDRRGPGAGEDFGNALHPVDLHRPLGNGAEHRAVVDFLKRLASLHVGAHLPHEEQHRHAVLHGGVHTDRPVGGARPPGHEADPRLTCQLAPGSGHERRTALVSAQNKIQNTVGVVERIERRQKAFARHAEALSRAQVDEAFDQNLSAVFHRAALSSDAADRVQPAARRRNPENAHARHASRISAIPFLLQTHTYPTNSVKKT